MKITSEKEHERCLRGIRQSRQIVSLKSKTENLERALTKAARDYEIEKVESEAQHQQIMTTLHTKLNQYTAICDLRDKELAIIRDNASNILRNRNAIETYFVDAIEQVRLWTPTYAYACIHA